MKLFFAEDEGNLVRGGSRESLVEENRLEVRPELKLLGLNLLAGLGATVVVVVVAVLKLNLDLVLV